MKRNAIAHLQLNNVRFLLYYLVRSTDLVVASKQVDLYSTEYKIYRKRGKIMTQETINFNAEGILRKCKASTTHCLTPNVKWKRFRHCNAYISNCILNRYFLVKSYNTIVAVIDDQQGELYELGKWSRTTSKQVTQIFNMTDYECYNNYGFSKLQNRYLCK